MSRTDGVISTFELCNRLGVAIKTRDIKKLGIEPDFTTGVGVYWAEWKVNAVRRALAKKLYSQDEEACGFILELETGLIDGVYFNQGIVDMYDIALAWNELRPQFNHIPCVTNVAYRPRYSENRALNRATWREEGAVL